MSSLGEKMHKFAEGNPVALNIANDIKSGKSFDEILDKYAKTPEMKQKIIYYKTQIENGLRAGISLKDVLNTHIKSETLKAEIHKSFVIDRSLNTDEK